MKCDKCEKVFPESIRKFPIHCKCGNKIYQPPDFIHKIFNFSKAIQQEYLSGRKPFKIPEEQFKLRFHLCHECELFNGTICTHKNCGCNVSDKNIFFNKLNWSSQKCPLEKWTAVHSEDYFEHLNIWNTFEQTPKIKIDAAIVTAADSNIWLGLHFFILSLVLSHETKIYVVDLGLEDWQLDWLKQNKIVIVKPKLKYTKEFMWQSINKPFYIDQIKEEKILWIDCDCIILRSLKPLSDYINKKFLIIKDYIAERNMPRNWRNFIDNNPELYKQIKVKERFTDFTIQAGVLGLKKSRDQYILDDWKDNLKYGQKLLSLWDQGALALTLEKLGLTKLVAHDKRHWNETVINIDNFQKSNCTIAHFAGGTKYWVKYQLKPFHIKENKINLKLYVLGHKQEQFDRIAKRHYMEFIDIKKLGKMDLAENSFYLQDITFDEEYVGLATGSWNLKYESRIDFVHTLNFKPNVIFAACPAHRTWLEHVHREHPTTEYLTLDIRDITGLDGKYRSLWSNNFICHRDVFFELLNFWRNCYYNLYYRYGDNINFNVGKYDATRKWGYVGERISMFYFTKRKDLEIIKI